MLRTAKQVALSLGIVATLSLAAKAQEMNASFPLVKSAKLPDYPMMARAARVSGTVRLKINTDGTRVTSVAVLDGPPMLAKAAEENVRTWEFAAHKPAEFITKFDYAFIQPNQCYYDNVQVTTSLPVQVSVKAPGVLTCDPATTTTHVRRP